MLKSIVEAHGRRIWAENNKGVVVLRSKLKVYLSIDISQLQDPLKRARDVKKIGHYSSGDTEIVLSERDEIPYALSLIKQAY
jgi:predicted transport protein